jgi:hypothetical protein
MNLFRKWLIPYSDLEEHDNEEIDSLARWHLRSAMRNAEPPPGTWQVLRHRLATEATGPRSPRIGLWRAFLQRTQPLAATALLVMLVGAALVRGQIGLLYGTEPVRSQPTVVPTVQPMEEEAPLRYTVLERSQPLPDGGVVSTSLQDVQETPSVVPQMWVLRKPREIRPS